MQQGLRLTSLVYGLPIRLIRIGREIKLLRGDPNPLIEASIPTSRG